ncbi:MAG: preprotein translocase subunit SecG [Muribaculaceae bacterium]|nr:preprotein translocase subunit SecG [Muribaculaceae bacterium]MDE5968470.1 preprotein translocase subunit SecG [Muribaculaceae bacterium]
MEIVLTVLTVLVSVLLIIVVLIQKSKGSGLSSQFAGSNQIMGVRRTTDFIEKATWTLAIIIMVLSVVATIIATKKSHTAEVNSVNPTKTEQAAPAPAQSFDTQLPAATAEQPVQAIDVEEAAVAVEAENAATGAE